MTPEQIEQERAAFEAWWCETIGVKERLRERFIKSSSPCLEMFKHTAEGMIWEAWLARAEQGGWISVEDRLPQCGCRIYLDIVYIDEEGDRVISEGVYVPNLGFSCIKPTVCGGELYWEEYEINTVTHWKCGDSLPPLSEGGQP